MSIRRTLWRYCAARSLRPNEPANVNPRRLTCGWMRRIGCRIPGWSLRGANG